MKDLKFVLREKEEAVARVSREIEALRAVVPLLADDLPAPDNIVDVSDPVSVGPKQLDGDQIADLETYYPFIKHTHIVAERARERDDSKSGRR